MENDGGPLYEQESDFIYHKEDLITLRPGREHAWLDGVLERILQKCRCNLLLVRGILIPRLANDADFCLIVSIPISSQPRNPQLYNECSLLNH